MSGSVSSIKSEWSKLREGGGLHILNRVRKRSDKVRHICRSDNKSDKVWFEKDCKVFEKNCLKDQIFLKIMSIEQIFEIDRGYQFCLTNCHLSIKLLFCLLISKLYWEIAVIIISNLDINWSILNFGKESYRYYINCI